MKTLVFGKQPSDLDFHTFVEVLHAQGKSVAVEFVFEPCSSSGNSDDIFELLDGKDFQNVVLLDRSHKPGLLVYFLMRDVESIDLYDPVLKKIAPYQPLRDKNSTVLLVFPGSILPLNMGSHQRAFHLLKALNDNGVYTDALITGSHAEGVKKSARLLQSICPNVFTYKNNKKRLSFFLRYRRHIERLLNKILGKGSVHKELFCDRLDNKSTFSLKSKLSSLLEEGNYKSVIISYAWMAKSLDCIPDSIYKDIKFLCDTHDVQYIRNTSIKQSIFWRLIRGTYFDRKVEKKVLNKFDYCLSISQSDHNELSKFLGDKAKLVTSAFDYAYMPIKAPDLSAKPMCFGFVGGGMEANVKAALYTLDYWWPQIKRFSPESKLLIAGGVGNNIEVRNKVRFMQDVNLVGYVDNLRDFYKKIDVALNPVLVQGGLNFKTVESVVSGKHLITNAMGSQCLGGVDIAWIVDEPANLQNILLKIECEDNDHILKKRQFLALKNFGCENSYTPLIEILLK